MTNWLSEIEGRIKNKYAQALESGEGDLALDVAITDGEDTTRVLRELAGVLKYIELDEGNAIIYAPEALIREMNNLSYFAKVLLKMEGK